MLLVNFPPLESSLKYIDNTAKPHKMSNYSVANTLDSCYSCVSSQSQISSYGAASI